MGLGTGLHTFLLFLGPFIAKVTLAAYECGSTDFKTPPYPDQIVCQDGAQPGNITLDCAPVFQRTIRQKN